MRYAMVIDLNRCTGCQACAMACKAQNGAPAGVWWSKVLETEEGTYPNSRVLYTPVLCMHCADAPCVEVCPTGASYKEESGIVSINADACIGCQLCVGACPYDARTYVGSVEPVQPECGFNPYEELMYAAHREGVVEKCTFCRDRVEQGEQPACVRTCPGFARFFGDIDDPESDVCKALEGREELAYQIRPEAGTDPSVYYLPKLNLVPKE